MAPNPLHALALLPLYFKRPLWVDPIAIAASSTFLDIEVAWLFISGSTSTHGIWHSVVLAGGVYPFIVTALVAALERGCPRQIEKTLTSLRWTSGRARYPLMAVYLSCLLGGLSHILFDMWTHPNSSYIMWPFVISSANPFYIGELGYLVDIAAVIFSAYSLFLWHKAAKGKVIRAKKEAV